MDPLFDMCELEPHWEDWPCLLADKVAAVALADLNRKARRTSQARCLAASVASTVVAGTPDTGLQDLEWYLDRALDSGAGLDSLTDWLAEQGWHVSQDDPWQDQWHWLDRFAGAEVEELWWDSLPAWNAAFWRLVDMHARLSAAAARLTAQKQPTLATCSLDTEDDKARTSAVQSKVLDDKPPPLHLVTPSHAPHGPPCHGPLHRPGAAVRRWHGQVQDTEGAALTAAA